MEKKLNWGEKPIFSSQYIFSGLCIFYIAYIYLTKPNLTYSNLKPQQNKWNFQKKTNSTQPSMIYIYDWSNIHGLTHNPESNRQGLKNTYGLRYITINKNS